MNNADHDMRDEEVKGPRGDKFDEFQGVENIDANQEDITILMELMMYFGKDVNIVQLFGMFETLHRKKGFDDVCPN